MADFQLKITLYISLLAVIISVHSLIIVAGWAFDYFEKVGLLGIFLESLVLAGIMYYSILRAIQDEARGQK